MEFKNVARYFDRDPVYDGYTGDYLYKLQITTYDGSQLDGSFIRRRTISMAPEIILPAHSILQFYDERWIFGEPIADGFYGEVVRKTCSSKYVTGLYDVSNLSTVLAGGAPQRQLYAHVRYLKGTADGPSTSEYTPAFEATFSQSEHGFIGRIISKGGEIYLASLEHTAAEGYTIVECDLISQSDDGQAGRVTVVLPGEYDQVEQEYGPGREIPGILMDRYLLYSRSSAAEEVNMPGDKTLLVNMADAPDVKGTIKINDREWAVQDSFPYSDGMAFHLRRV